MLDYPVVHSNAPVYVIGHRNPDTDAICSAIGNAAFLRLNGLPQAVAARCGEIPARTQWVLEQAGLEAPLLMHDVRPTAATICHRNVISVTADCTFLNAYRCMLDNNVRAVPVVNQYNHVVGILRYFDLLKLLMPSDLEGMAVRTVHACTQKIAQTIKAEVLTTHALSNVEDDLVLMVGASSEKTVLKRLQGYRESGLNKRLVVICGDRPNVQRYAVENDALLLVITSGFTAEPEVLELAKSHKTTIMSCKSDTASAAKLIRCARTIAAVQENDFLTFEPTTPLDEVKKIVAKSSQILFPVVDASRQQLIGVFSKTDLVDPPRTKLVLVDHNEYSQAVFGIEEAEVIEVLDHHRLGGDLTSREPMRFLMEPVGSTSTLVARRFFHRNLQPEPGIAMCLCAGILSDTINLTSPTTTEMDREILAKLCRIAGIDARKFTADFFASGSLLQGGNMQEILTADCKIFNEQGCMLNVAQIEEVGFGGLGSMELDILGSLEQLHAGGKYDLACLLVTDVTSNNSLLYVAARTEILQEIEYPRLRPGVYDAKGVVSRKKQLLPALTSAVRRSGLV